MNLFLVDFNQLESLCGAGSQQPVQRRHHLPRRRHRHGGRARRGDGGGGRRGEAAAESDAETSRHEGAMASSRNIWFISPLAFAL